MSKIKQILDDKKKRVSEIIKTHYFEERQLSHDEIMDLIQYIAILEDKLGVEGADESR